MLIYLKRTEFYRIALNFSLDEKDGIITEIFTLNSYNLLTFCFCLDVLIFLGLLLQFV